MNWLQSGAIYLPHQASLFCDCTETLHLVQSFSQPTISIVFATYSLDLLITFFLLLLQTTQRDNRADSKQKIRQKPYHKRINCSDKFVSSKQHARSQLPSSIEKDYKQAETSRNSINAKNNIIIQDALVSRAQTVTTLLTSWSCLVVKKKSLCIASLVRLRLRYQSVESQ